ncbi:hypothetical protein QA640_08435 [Bradyrhizobium sp. CB82]|uniref:hypothetical protein n=1 Tax=Bradyrhizobium sp. CB82 TaxID=3039159 RepID=UPI0024B1EE54|nr:hypothetical protein [Bradyrhizobium sp. CB82]WFU42478.1 hypothetical protein QA640_08435 [Bradyrhizobium sp. CB82]
MRIPIQPPVKTHYGGAPILERDELGMNRHRASGYCSSMIFPEIRFTLFRIMLHL